MQNQRKFFIPHAHRHSIHIAPSQFELRLSRFVFQLHSIFINGELNVSVSEYGEEEAGALYVNAREFLISISVLSSATYDIRHSAIHIIQALVSFAITYIRLRQKAAPFSREINFTRDWYKIIISHNVTVSESSMITSHSSVADDSNFVIDHRSSLVNGQRHRNLWSKR